MKIKKIASLILATFLTASSISHVVASEQAVVEEVSQEPVTVNAEATAVQNHTILEGTSLGNTYHRLNKETVTDETGFTYIKLTPTTQALVPKVDRYSLNMQVGEYNYMKVMYKTTVDNSIPFFNIMNGTGITLLEGFKPSPANEWVSAIIAINTTDNAVLNQYHFSIFGETLTANNLQGEEFCLAYIGFFKYYWDAVDYQSSISGNILSTDGLGRPYCINSYVFSNNYHKIYGPDDSCSFEYDEEENALKAIVGGNSGNAKIQFKASELTNVPFIKDEYNFVKIRYKYNVTYDDRIHSASLREGYTVNSSLHSLYTVPQNMNNVWREDIASIDWGTASEGYDTLTFIPMSGGGIFSDDYILIEYIAFFEDYYSAEQFDVRDNESIIMTSVDFYLSSNKPFDPDNILCFSNSLENDGSLKMTFNQTAKTGKMQFDVYSVANKSINKDLFRFMKIRYKHDFTNYSRMYSMLREGYSSEASLHQLFEIGAPNTWHEKVVELNWGENADKNNILTFHPIRESSDNEYFDYAYANENFYIDYIAFFQTEYEALNYENLHNIAEYDMHGDNELSAYKVKNDNKYPGFIQSLTDKDYFEFTPSNNGDYVICTNSVNDVLINLYDSQGDLLSTSSRLDNNIFIKYEFNSDNVYYIEILGNEVGFYSMMINETSPDPVISINDTGIYYCNDISNESQVLVYSTDGILIQSANFYDYVKKYCTIPINIECEEYIIAEMNDRYITDTYSIQVFENSFSIALSENEYISVPVIVYGISNLSDMYFSFVFDGDFIQVDDICEITQAKEVQPGIVDLGNIIINNVSDNSFTFEPTFNINQSWNGLVNITKLKSKQNAYSNIKQYIVNIIE